MRCGPEGTSNASNPVALVSAVFFQHQKSLDSDFHQNDKHTAHRAQCKNVVRPRFSNQLEGRVAFC